MKELMQSVKSFITFDAPSEFGSIKTLFTATHQQQKRMIPEWCTASTRQKLKAYYWYSYVPGHFALLLTLPVLHFFLSSGSIESGHLLVLLIVLALAFGVLGVGLYRPFYLQDFLPNLEAVINGYHENQQREVIARQQEIITRQDHEIRLLKQVLAVQAKQYFMVLENWRQETLTNAFQQGQLQKTIDHQREKIAQQQAEIQQLTEAITKQSEERKCRDAQFSTLTLILIYRVLAEKAGLPALEGTDKTCQLLTKLFGKSNRGIRDNLELVIGKGGKFRELDNRELTETRKRFDMAVNFFKEQNYPEAARILNELEAKMKIIRS